MDTLPAPSPSATRADPSFAGSRSATDMMASPSPSPEEARHASRHVHPPSESRRIVARCNTPWFVATKSTSGAASARARTYSPLLSVTPADGSASSAAAPPGGRDANVSSDDADDPTSACSERSHSLMEASAPAVTSTSRPFSARRVNARHTPRPRWPRSTATGTSNVAVDVLAPQRLVESDFINPGTRSAGASHRRTVQSSPAVTRSGRSPAFAARQSHTRAVCPKATRRAATIAGASRARKSRVGTDHARAVRSSEVENTCAPSSAHVTRMILPSCPRSIAQGAGRRPSASARSGSGSGSVAEARRSAPRVGPR